MVVTYEMVKCVYDLLLSDKKGRWRGSIERWAFITDRITDALDCDYDPPEMEEQLEGSLHLLMGATDKQFSEFSKEPQIESGYFHTFEQYQEELDSLTAMYQSIVGEEK